MPKRKRRKSGNKSGLHLGKLLLAGGHFFLRSLPFVLAVVMGGSIFLGVRKALYADSSLAVQQIVVDPPQGLSSSEREVLESVLLGKNILKIKLEQIARGLEKNPEIQNARVTRLLPSRLKIEIEKRKPIAYIQFAPKGLFGLISDDGMILDVFPKPESSLFVVEAYAAGLKAPPLGARVKVQGFPEAIDFVKAYWGHSLARVEALSRISLDHLGNVTVILGEGPSIRLGRKPAERLGAFEQIIPLLSEEERSNIDYVDLQFDHVIVKRKKG